MKKKFIEPVIELRQFNHEICTALSTNTQVVAEALEESMTKVGVQQTVIKTIKIDWENE
jgi:hypothetical protein